MIFFLIATASLGTTSTVAPGAAAAAAATGGPHFKNVLLEFWATNRNLSPYSATRANSIDAIGFPIKFSIEW